MIPDSTRSFIGYLFGVPDPDAFTWDDLVAIQNQPFVNPPLNQTNTMASSADDLVSFYSRALPGEFFQNEATLQEFRALLSIGDIIWILPFPLGVCSFAKGGEIDSPGFHALSAAGGMFFDDVWAFFCFIINWPAPEQSDPATQDAWARLRRHFSWSRIRSRHLHSGGRGPAGHPVVGDDEAAGGDVRRDRASALTECKAMAERVDFTLNGSPVSVRADRPAPAGRLREELDVTSPKDGCSPSGQCGCCTVHIDGKAVVSCCNLPLAKVAGVSVITLEGVDPDERQRYADAFAACGGCSAASASRAS